MGNSFYDDSYLLRLANLEPEQDILWKSINLWPGRPGKALLRAIEAKIISEHLTNGLCLDFGCGDGVFSSLLPRGIDVGVDKNLNRCFNAQKNKAYVLTVQCDGPLMPLSSNYFDIVICNSVLEHISSLHQTVNEINRVLKFEGFLLLTVPSLNKRKHLFYADESLYSDRGSGEEYRQFFDKHWNHLHYLSDLNWREFLQEVGFSIIEEHYYETPETTQIIDLLENIRIVYQEWKSSSNNVEQIWSRILYHLLYPFYISTATEDGSGIFFLVKKTSL